MSLSNFGVGLYAMLDHDRSAAYAVQANPYINANFPRGSPHHPPEILQDDQPPSPSATSAPIQISPRRPYNTYTPSYQGSPDPRSWQQSAQLDHMYESEFLDADNSYNPDFDRSPLSHTSGGHPSPYLTNTEDFLASGLFINSPAFFVQPPTRNNTVLSPPLESFRYSYQKGISPESSVGEDYVGEPNDLLFGHRSRTHSRASSISSAHTQALSNSHFTGASTSPALVPGDLSEFSPRINDFSNLQLVDNQWGGFHMPNSASTSNGSEPGSNAPSPYAKPQSPPALVIPSDQSGNGGFDPSASLFDQTQPGLAPPPPARGLSPATPVTPPANQLKLGFQEILRQQVAQRRAACESPFLRAYPSSFLVCVSLKRPCFAT
jgi:hypothetical protein